MKYLQFTYVDAKTKKPLTEEPAANGPTIPEGIVPLYDIQASRSNEAPLVYGWTEDDEYDPPSFIYEITEDTFFSNYKNELKERARVKRKQIEQGGITLNDQRISTTIEDQNRISNMVTSLNLVPTMTVIDFEASPGNWISLPREVGLQIGAALAEHVQACFTWCKGVHDTIDAWEASIENLDPVIDILNEINSFGQEPIPEIPEDPVVE